MNDIDVTLFRETGEHLEVFELEHFSYSVFRSLTLLTQLICGDYLVTAHFSIKLTSAILSQQYTIQILYQYSIYTVIIQN